MVLFCNKSVWLKLRHVECHQHLINPLNAELNSICHLLALLGTHHILHISRIRVNNLRYVHMSICVLQ